MATPSSVRLWKHGVQRRVVAALNGVANARVRWDKGVAEGKAAGAAMTNACLTSGVLSECDLGVLADCPNILESATVKLAGRMRKGVLALRAAHEQLELVLAAMDFALDGFSEEFVPTSLVGTPESAGVHRAASRGPVFNCLSVSTLEALACEMVQMFRAEVEVKRRVVAEAARLLLEDEADDARDHTELRARLEVCLATWMLEPEIDTRRLDEILWLLDEEMTLPQH